MGETAAGGTSAAGARGGCVSPAGEGSTWRCGEPQAIHLPCKGACKTLEILPNWPKASSRGWGTRNSEFTASGEMSQDPKAFISGLDSPGMAPNEEVCKGDAAADIPGRTHTPAGTRGCLGAFLRADLSLCPTSDSGSPEHSPAEQSQGMRALRGPFIPSSGNGGSRGEGGQDPPGPCHTPAMPQGSSGCAWLSEGAGLGWGACHSTWQCP